MKNKYLKMAAIAVAFGTTFSACKKVDEIKETTVSAEDNATMESAFASTYDVADDVSSSDSRFGKSGNTILPSGAVFTVTDSIFDTDGDGIAYTLDFGSSANGILCNDGIYRAGILRIEQSKKFSEIDCQLTIDIVDADGYYIGDGTHMTHITGKSVITRTAENEANFKVTDGKGKNDNGTIEFYTDKTVKRTVDNGVGTIGDEFEASGNGGGKNRNGDTYTYTTPVPLYKKIQDGCSNTFVKGKIELTNSSNSTLTIDFDPYNDGACDKIAEVTLPGNIKKIITVN